MKRCSWCDGNDLYVDYHDKEWGVPVYDDRKQFEFLVLESAQAGLSWLTILKRRDNYRKAYDNFDPKKVAAYNDKKIKKLVNNVGIIRNIRKIEASVNNASLFLDIQKEYGSFSDYLWGFVNNRQVLNSWKDLSEVPANTDLSDKITKDLKSRGFKFLGSTILYAHLQAVGIVNDHIVDCFRYKEVSV